VWSVVRKLAILVLVFIATFWAIFSAYPKIRYHAGLRGESFDSVVWKSEAGKSGLQHSPRRPMIRSLTKTHMRIGMTRSNVKEVLGEPRGIKGPQSMDYWLGGPGGFFMDHDLLEIFLDESEKVTHWRVGNT
jgi:hypothetical protein